MTGLSAQVDLRQYIYELMVSTGGCASAGYPIASCKIYSDKSYAFLEFRSVEEASNCMAFDGVAFKDSYLRVRRSLQMPILPPLCISVVIVCKKGSHHWTLINPWHENV